VATVRVVNRVFDQQGMDYVTWIMDDHVVQWRDGWRYPRGFEQEFARHLRHARRVMVISPAMARLYEDRFGVRADVLFGPADSAGLPVNASPTASGPVRLCYFGATRSWQRDALERLARTLPAMNAELDIFTFDGSGLEAPGLRVLAPVAPVEVTRRMRTYDGVVIPVSFAESDRGLAALNIATKMSECLASGTVVVAVGPEYAAMVQFIRHHDCGMVMTDLDDHSQIAAVARLKDRRYRTERLERAAQTLQKHCSSASMRATWERCWAEAAGREPRETNSRD
jgi:hypothetical protein